MDAVARAVLAYNNGVSFFKTASSWTIPIKGVVLHKIDAATALAVSKQVTLSAAAAELPLPYVLGCLAIESVLDPACQNGNLGPGESNTADDPLGYDMGISQIKLRYLIGHEGVSDAASARAFALDVAKAIPYHCSIMAGNVAWAEDIIAKDTSAHPDPRMKNPLILATWAYNAGRTGSLVDFSNGTWPAHCQQVLDLTNYFSKALGVPPLFTSS